MKKRNYFILMIAIAFISQNLFAQNTYQKVFKVGVFAPLYLDSVFANSQLRSDKAIPKFIMPAVEFVQGAQIAFDTLSLYNQHVEAFIYDTKSFTQSLPWLIQNRLLDSLDLIIGSVKDVDFKQLADFSAKRNIPFISATYPNDGGVTDNPDLIIMNSTLRAHCEGIHSYILQSHGTDKIILLKKKGAQEDKIESFIKAVNEQEGKPPLLNIQTINIDSTITPYFLKTRLDSTKHTVIIAGSLDEAFAKNITDVCYAVHKSYPVTLIGMPNWDGFKIFQKNAYKDFPVHFTTPYYNSRTSLYNTLLTNEYMRRFKSKPSDMAYKGFESAFLFTKILLKYPNDFLLNLNDKSFSVFDEYNFRPVYFKKNSKNPDYLENKHLYVMRILNGAVTREW